MKIYKTEISDGLEQVIKSNASVAICSAVEKYFPSEDEILSFSKVVAEVADQPDLFYLKSILVSVGKNKNDDVFLKEEMLKSINTPLNKQFNYMHMENDIIGHITSACVVDHDGNKIEDMSDIPDEFDIVIDSVLYNSWSDPELKSRMFEIIDDIEKERGKWKVSMECIFRNFDYLVTDNDTGQSRLVIRNESSAFLTKHLRAYGGSGVYENMSIARVLRNFIYSGVGLVDSPANPRSKILKGKRGNPMAEKEVADLKDQLAAASETSTTQDETIASLTTKIEELKNVEKQVEELKTQAQDSANKLAEITSQLEAAQAENAQLTKSNKELSKTLADVQSEFASLKLDVIKKERTEKLVKAGLSETEIEVDSISSLSDKAFNSLVKMVSAAASKTNVETETVENNEEDTNEVDDTVLDTAKSTASTTNFNVQETEPIKAYAEKWFEGIIRNSKGAK